MISGMLSARSCQGIVAALTGRSCRGVSGGLVCAGPQRWQQRAAFSSEPPEGDQGEDISEEAKAAMEEEAKRKAAEAHAARVKDFAQSRKTFKMEMSKIRKELMHEVAKKAEQETRAANKDSATAVEEAQARREARRARALANIEAHKAKAATAQLAKAKVKEEKAQRLQQRQAFFAEGADLRRQMLAHNSRTWVAEEELEERIMLALKYPDNLR